MVPVFGEAGLPRSGERELAPSLYTSGGDAMLVLLCVVAAVEHFGGLDRPCSCLSRQETPQRLLAQTGRVPVLAHNDRYRRWRAHKPAPRTSSARFNWAGRDPTPIARNS